MRKTLYLLSLFLLVTTCDDGDVMDVKLDFDRALSMCDLSQGNYFLYDIKKNPAESLSLIFPKNSRTDSIFNPPKNNYKTTLTIDGTATKFNYRTYDGSPENLICSLLPDATVNIIKDYVANSGTVTIITSYVDDDDDGIPANVEDANLDGDDDPSTNPTDTDGDGIPDYLDADDDNDNVLTKDEKHNYSKIDGLSKAQDTDGDGIPDYLDNDDDGDGVLTRFEDENLNGNPMDDRDKSSPTPTVPRYLDKEAKDSFDYQQLNKNVYKRTYTIKFYIENVNLEVISLTEVDFGTYTYTVNIESE